MQSLSIRMISLLLLTLVAACGGATSRHGSAGAD